MEKFKPMPELKQAYKKPELGFIGPPVPPIISLETSLQRYEKAIEKSTAVLNTVGTDKGPARLNPGQYNPEQFHPERYDPQKAMLEIPVPENITGNDGLDAFIEAGKLRIKARDEARAQRDQETRKKQEEEKNQRRVKKEYLVVKSYFANETLPILTQKTATIKETFELEKKRVEIEDKKNVYSEEEYKRAQEFINSNIDTLTKEPELKPAEKPEKAAAPARKPAKKSVEEPREHKKVFFVEFPDQKIPVKGKIKARYLKALSTTDAKYRIKQGELKKLVHEEEPVATSSLRVNISNIKKFLKDYGWTIGFHFSKEDVQAGQEQEYYLKKIKGKKPAGRRIWKKPEAKEKTQPYITEQVIDTEVLKALNYIVENPECSLENIKELIQKPDTPYSNRTTSTLVRTVILTLDYRRLQEKLNPEESKFIAGLKEKLKGDDTEIDEIEAIKRLKQIVKEWLEKEESKPRQEPAKPAETIEEEAATTETIEEELELEKISDDESMVLAGIIGTLAAQPVNSDIVPQIHKDTIKICKDFAKTALEIEPEFAENLTLEEYKKLRAEVLLKIKQMTGKKREEIIDQQSEDAKIILISLCCSDHGDQLSTLTEYLSITQEKNGHIREMQSVIAIWNEWSGQTAQSTQQKTSPTMDEQIEETLMTFEQQNRDARVEINRILDSIESISQMETFKYGQITLFLPQKTGRNFAIWAIENGYISPEKGEDHHPVYKKWEIAVLKYLWSKQYSGGMNRGHIPALHKIVQQEVAKREEEKAKAKSDLTKAK